MAKIYSSVDEKFYKTPDMGDYYDEDLIEEMMTSIDPNNPKNATYYVETPFSTALGYHPDYEAFVLKADAIIKKNDYKYGGTTGAEKEYLNDIDADTISFYLDSVDDGGMPFELNGEKYKGFKDYVYNQTDFTTFKQKVFKIRTIGINAPEVPHYKIVPMSDEDAKTKLKEVSVSEMKRGGYIYEINKARTQEKYPFIFIDNKWREVVNGRNIDGTYGSRQHPFKDSEEYDGANKNEDDTSRYYTCLVKDEQSTLDMNGDVNLGLLATREALDLLESAQDMRIVVDAKQLQTSANYSEIQKVLMEGWSEDNSLWEVIKAMYISTFGESKTTVKYSGFGTFGQDSYKRFLGAIYVKAAINGAPTAWINLAKYVRSKVGDRVELMKGLDPVSQDDGNGVSDAFKVWSYDNSNTLIADGFYNISQADFDDRRQIQREITGLDFSQYRDFTVMIGDCLFMVPPTSIRIVNQVDSNRVPLLRSKGSMTKTKPHNDRLIEMTLYFNGEEGINGIPIKKQLPKQKGTNQYETYYMNGLRSLIAMFRYTPFMPVENKYLNDVLGIEAVSLANLQIQTMPMYPKCLAVTLTLQQFNYRIYLNELPLPDPEEGQDFNYNMYARTINYGIMRYYYQRAIQAGEAIKNLSTSSQEYIESTMGSKTKLIPMEFKDQNIRFQILDSNWLDKMKSIKELAAKQPIQQTQALNQKTLDWANRVGVSMYHIIEAVNDIEACASPSFNSLENPILWLQEKLLTNQTCPHLVEIGDGVESSNGTYDFSFVFDTDSLTKEELQNLMIVITNELNIKKNDADRLIFEDGIITISAKLSKDVHTDGETDYKCDTSTDDYAVAQFFAFRSGMFNEGELSDDIDNDDWDGFSTVVNEAFFENMKDNAIDEDSLLSAKFKDYPLDIVVQQFSISMGNILSNTKLKIHEGYAPQYAGGQDTVLDFVFHTTDESTVTLLNNMQQMAAEQLIKYRQVISCWPIRIDSEMTRLCGIHEVIIESVDISTVPMQPGLFAIQCRAISVDRTMRNREALRKIDDMNNAGSVNPDAISSWVYKTYFDLNKTLSKAEVYPDLELPTIDELESTGYKFIRYVRNREMRIYPDPDFYFVYGYAYSSQMLRKSIIEYFDKQVTDDKGNTSAVITQARTSYVQSENSQETFASMNSENPEEVIYYDHQNKELDEKYKEAVAKDINYITSTRQKSIEEDKKYEDKIRAAEDLYNQSTYFEDQLMALSPKSWDICSAIKCTLPEELPEGEEGTLEDNVKKELKDVSSEIIAIIDEALSKPIDATAYSDSSIRVGYDYHKILRKEIKKFIENETKGNSVWQKIISTFKTSIDSKTKKNIRAIYEAAAMALSGNTEYSEDINKDNYCARAYFFNNNVNDNYSTAEDDYTSNKIKWFPNSIIIDKNTGDIFNANNIDNAIANGITFGPYQVRRYDANFLKDFYSDKSIHFSDMDFLDPYYNKELHKDKFGKDIDNDEYVEYKSKMINSTGYAIEAFHRVVLAWVKKLIQDNIYISFYDIRRDDISNQLNGLIEEVTGEPAYNNVGYLPGDYTNSTNSTSYYSYNVQEYQKMEKEKKVNEIVQPLTDKGKDVADIVKTYEGSILTGKIFLPVLCAVIHGDDMIYERIKQKDIGTLKIKTRQCSLPFNASDEVSDGERNFRKMIKGLAVTDPEIMNGLEAIASESYTKLESALIDRNQKLWLKASQDPSAWVLHSFYDMVTKNKRGRMARAFPTYYMMLIDEGREIGYWKLHDNFYNMNSIAEIEVTKSRKMPADTATIVMTNMFKTFSTEDEDVRTNYEHNVRDVFNSIFSPNVYFEEEEAARMAQMNIHRATIKPGVRIHLRMGYSGDASELPILFNGVVTEASTGELIEIVAQSDGHEIVNAQAFAGTAAEDAADIKNESALFKWFYNFFTEGATPKTLIRNIFTTKSGFWGKMANKFTNGRFFNDNMFGITHFGEIDYKAIHKDGEIMQNIYEAEGRMPWQKEPTPGSMMDEHVMAEAPSFTIELKDKSVWDILNICASTSLEFITGVAPFGIRSTIFFGRPHYYYAYDYAISEDGLITEKRKPFQQYHIIDSYSDIIGNNIKASGADIKTVAVPIYKGPGAANKIIEKKLNPIWADWDIYPEFQKTMVVNTGLTWKANKMGALLVNKFKDEWSKSGGQKIAWRMGATALKNSFKDMYQGEVIIIGDTSIKPLDKVFLHDVYENMNGAVEVEAVVHRLSPETGFTSSVFADCISCVDSRYEEIGRMWTSQIANQIALAKSISYISSLAFGNSTRPMLNVMARTVNKGAYKTAEMANKAMEFIGKDELIKYGSMEKWSDAFYSTMNLSSQEVAVWNKVSQLGGIKKKISILDINNIDTAADIIDNLGNIVKVTDGFNPSDVADTLESAIKNGSIKKNHIDDVNEAIKALRELKIDTDGLTTSIKNLSSSVVSQLESVSGLTDEAKDSIKYLKSIQSMDTIDVKKAMESLDSVKDLVNLKDDIKQSAEMIGKYGKQVLEITSKADDIVKGSKVASAVTATVTTAGVLSSALLIAAEMAITYVIQKSIYNWIENRMASFNVLTVYPLKKNGVVHVAGIDGHKGLVHGSPTWNQAGPIDSFINWVFKERNSGFSQFLDIFVFSDEMKAIAETYKKDNKLGSYADDKEQTITGLLKSIAEGQASSYSNYKAIVHTERVTDINAANAKYTYKKTRVKSDLNDIPNHPAVLNELVPIDASNEALVEYFSPSRSPRLKTIHLSYTEYDGNTDNKIDYEEFKIDNTKSYGNVFRGIKLSENTVDIPFLRPDAFQLFKRLIDLIIIKSGNKGYGDNENSTIWFKSGTIVNDNSWSSTGYVFRFEVTNISDDIVIQAFEDAAKELREIFVDENKQDIINIFQHRKVKNSNAYEVFVCPRDEYFKLQLN